MCSQWKYLAVLGTAGAIGVIGGWITFQIWGKPKSPASLPMQARQGRDRVTGFGVAGQNAKMVVDEKGIHMSVDKESDEKKEEKEDSSTINEVHFGVAGNGATLHLSGPIAKKMIEDVTRRSQDD